MVLAARELGEIPAGGDERLGAFLRHFFGNAFDPQGELVAAVPGDDVTWP